ncbi:uncharacterized protein LOC134242636 [Saccostrea cucullata]|uniref:uncharacterized protein LOC134242636 n=1 Tax=Saccostrea cuccullata TaxID=36930 RepID=UPI002ED37770
MGMSPVMYSDGRVHRKPCIAFYCLDADLVPFGEKPLPSVLSDSSGDIPCDVREDYIQLGYCRNCRGLQNGCSVGQYGVQLSGSIGFFVRRKYSSHTPQLPYDGFLTAAHVALEDDILKKMKGTKFKNCYHGLHLIVHPSLEDSGTNNVIGEVEDSFFGNHEEVGIDAAFVKTYKNEGNGKQIINGLPLHILPILYISSLSFEVDPDMEYEVIGHGRTSGTTTGILKETFMSFRKSFPERAGIYLVLDNCFTIYRIRIEPKEFFEPGDSGSAVYVVEADNTQHPLGLAFGVLGEHKITFASPVKKITDILNLSVVQPAQPMNIP